MTNVLSVVQKVDDVTEGMERYGGKIISVEADLKNLSESTHKLYCKNVLLPFDLIALFLVYI